MSSTIQLRALGFCGADDSVHPNQLAIYSQMYPFIEWGVLFRPDKEGQPRYASQEWVSTLAKVARRTNNTTMKLAAHLCEQRVNQVLDGDDSFVQQLYEWGFRRVQINATAVNGVDTSKLGESVTRFLTVVSKHPHLEFILQKNEETEPLWKGILQMNDNEGLARKVGHLPKNVSMLLDESKGTGVLATSWPAPPQEYEIGYAGGIGPENIRQVLANVVAAAHGRMVWIDMESRLRSQKNGTDVFDLDKCYKVILAVCEAGLHPHPTFLMD